jgi:hypothetical protein
VFDRPLAHAAFGHRFVAGTVAVLPMIPEQLEGTHDCDGTTDPDDCLAPTMLPVSFATEEASFLAGAAAARTPGTGVIRFLGGNPSR